MNYRIVNVAFVLGILTLIAGRPAAAQQAPQQDTSIWCTWFGFCSPAPTPALGGSAGVRFDQIPTLAEMKMETPAVTPVVDQASSPAREADFDMYLKKFDTKKLDENK